ncbi:hypothetical protein Hanom_Chr15g01399141 [Helianthus anomalus]
MNAKIQRRRTPIILNFSQETMNVIMKECLNWWMFFGLLWTSNNDKICKIRLLVSNTKA